MELTDRQTKIILDLIQIAWKTGAVRSEDEANDLRQLKQTLTEKK